MSEQPNLAEIKPHYQRDGYVSGIDILSDQQAASHCQAFETAEQKIGKLHYKSKVHTILKSPYQIAILPSVLDIVEQLIGPNILLYNVTYIVKEPHASSHVSWHQDLTYWGLSHDDQVSMWLALTPATPQNGCMRMIPASHKRGRVDHETTNDKDNVLLQGQTVDGICEDDAKFCPLLAGQASFHHGWTLHASSPNQTNERRIGLNIQYLATHISQTKNTSDTAMLVRGNDEYQNFGQDIPANQDLSAAALKRQAALEAHYKLIAGNE